MFWGATESCVEAPQHTLERAKLWTSKLLLEMGMLATGDPKAILCGI